MSNARGILHRLTEPFPLPCLHCDAGATLLPSTISVTYKGKEVDDPINRSEGDCHMTPLYFLCRVCNNVTCLLIENNSMGTSIRLWPFPKNEEDAWRRIP
jgi:hypothetical protein